MSKQLDAPKDLVQSPDMPTVGLKSVEQTPFNSLLSLQQYQQNVDNINRSAESIQNSAMDMQGVDRQMALNDHRVAVDAEAENFNALQAIKEQQFHMDTANHANDLKLQMQRRYDELEQYSLTNNDPNFKLTDATQQMINEFQTANLYGTNTKYQTDYLKNSLAPAIASMTEQSVKTQFGIAQTKLRYYLDTNINLYSGQVQSGTKTVEQALQLGTEDIINSKISVLDRPAYYDRLMYSTMNGAIQGKLALGTPEALQQAKDLIVQAQSGYAVKGTDGQIYKYTLDTQKIEALDKEVDSAIGHYASMLPTGSEVMKPTHDMYGGKDRITQSVINGKTWTELSEIRDNMIKQAFSVYSDPKKYAEARDIANSDWLNMSVIKSASTIATMSSTAISNAISYIDSGLKSGLLYQHDKAGNYLPLYSKYGTIKLYPVEMAINDGTTNKDWVTRYYTGIKEKLTVALKNANNPNMNWSDSNASYNPQFKGLINNTNNMLKQLGTSAPNTQENSLLINSLTTLFSTKEKANKENGRYGDQILLPTESVKGIMSGYQAITDTTGKQAYILSILNAAEKTGATELLTKQIMAMYGKNGQLSGDAKDFVSTMIIGNNPEFLAAEKIVNQRILNSSLGNQDIHNQLGGLQTKDMITQENNSPELKRVMSNFQISGPYKNLLKEKAVQITEGIMLKNNKTGITEYGNIFNTVVGHLLDDNFANIQVKDSKGGLTEVLIPKRLVKDENHRALINNVTTNTALYAGNRTSVMGMALDGLNYSVGTVKATVEGNKVVYYADTKNPLNGTPGGTSVQVSVLKPTGGKYNIGYDINQLNNIPKGMTDTQWANTYVSLNNAILTASQRYEALRRSPNKTPLMVKDQEALRKSLVTLTAPDTLDKLRTNHSFLNVVLGSLNMEKVDFTKDNTSPYKGFNTYQNTSKSLTGTALEARYGGGDGASFQVPNLPAGYTHQLSKTAFNAKYGVEGTNPQGGGKSGSGGGGWGASGGWGQQPKDVIQQLIQYGTNHYVSPIMSHLGTIQDFSPEMSQLNSRPKDIISHLNSKFGGQLQISSQERHDGSSHDPAKNNFIAYDVTNFQGMNQNKKMQAFKILLQDPTTKNIMTNDPALHKQFGGTGKLVPLNKVIAWDKTHGQDHGTHWHVQTVEPWQLKANMGGYDKTTVMHMLDRETEIAHNREGKHPIPAALVKAVAQVESGFNIHAKSGAGAIGVMQMMPNTFKGLNNPGADINDPELNIRTGILYLQNLFVKYDGDIEKTLAAYNTGPGTVANKGITTAGRQYINKVMKSYATFNRYSG